MTFCIHYLKIQKKSLFSSVIQQYNIVLERNICYLLKIKYTIQFSSILDERRRRKRIEIAANHKMVDRENVIFFRKEQNDMSLTLSPNDPERMQKFMVSCFHGLGNLDDSLQIQMKVSLFFFFFRTFFDYEFLIFADTQNL